MHTRIRFLNIFSYVTIVVNAKFSKFSHSLDEKCNGGMDALLILIYIWPSLVYCLFPVTECSKNRGGREVIINY